MMQVGGCCGEVINPVAAVCLDLIIASAVTVNAIILEYMGICPLALARAESQKDQLFFVLEGEQGHLGTEILDIVLSAEDVICPLLGR